mmetsp:Transcript_13928/g.18214  ORF Transcript_13928/g.18214 Transcript_13928/m.18214 type:complete len:258 (+) Transcript_13928:97-870(+)
MDTVPVTEEKPEGLSDSQSENAKEEHNAPSATKQIDEEEEDQPACIWDTYKKFCGVKILVHEDYDAGLGGTLFDGALCLCNYIEYLKTNENVSFKGKKVIELGAGCGLPGLLLASLGAAVDITDIEQTVELIEENIENNEENIRLGEGKAVARILDWFSEGDRAGFDGDYDFILAADTVYNIEVIRPYLETLKSLSNDHTKILFAHPAPREAKASAFFWSIVYDEFHVEKISTQKFVPGESDGFQSPTNGVFVMRKK